MMLSRFITIVSLFVFLILLVSGSSIVPAAFKSSMVFFALVIGYVVFQLLIPVISNNPEAEKESSGDSA